MSFIEKLIFIEILVDVQTCDTLIKYYLLTYLLTVLLFVTEGHPTWESIVDTLIIQTVQS